MNKFPSKIMQYVTIVMLFIGIFSLSEIEAYEIRLEGVHDPKVIELIRSVSQLEKLKETPPSTLIGLKRRAEGDTANLVEALHSLGYYNAKISLKIEPQGPLVIVTIDPGPIYPLDSFEIHYFENGEETEPLCNSITLKDLHIYLGEPALPETILKAEEELLNRLNLQGYAFASIIKREVFADQQNKNVLVIINVETGPLTYFGPLTIIGLKRVHEEFIYKKLRWHEGDLYDPVKVEKTQEALEMAGLFRSINFTHGEQPVDENELPMEVNILEGKQRSIGYGLNYTSELGPGISGEWEDRNILGLGQKFSIRTNLWVKLQEGSLTYLIPDYKMQNQNLVWQIDYTHEQTKAFIESAVSLSATIERKWSEHLRFSYGAMYKLLHSGRSANNGTFNLIKIPLQVRWSNTDSLLDPTEGASIQLRIIPSFQTISPIFAYCINTVTTTFYKPMTADKKHVFATKLMLGSILGAPNHDIPPPERFYAGSENTLRGYKFLTVSPLNKDKRKPIGGRSLFVYSVEWRSRISENLGLVAFYDIGNVYRKYQLNFKRGLLQSTGLGLRYHTPVGPLRLDVAIPLNRRKHLDDAFEVYFSIGQSF